ncbi:PBPRA1643 family SWIM/SEC-C metal-binding motif protein [Aliamphritea spongicola]|nr:PBPRA1643 family SWIM/SEC-C metal-binding motif protein [Aliamphritea spongicola]
MSKFFFKGTPDIMGNYGKSGYNPKPNVKAGSEAHPLAISVQTEARKEEVAALLVEHDLVGNIDVNPEAPENLAELEAMINTRKPSASPLNRPVTNLAHAAAVKIQEVLRLNTLSVFEIALLLITLIICLSVVWSTVWLGISPMPSSKKPGRQCYNCRPTPAPARCMNWAAAGAIYSSHWHGNILSERSSAMSSR